MTDPTEDLMQQLAAANPVDHRTVPSTNDPDAQRLLENTMNEVPNPDAADRQEPVTMIDQHGNAYISSHGPTGPASANPIDGTDVRDGVRPSPVAKRSLIRGRAMLVGAAAAVLLLVGGLLVFSPDSTPSAVATVHSAAAAAADSDTGRISTSFSLRADGDSQVEHVEGRFDAAYSGTDVQFSLQVDEQSGEFGVDDLPITDARLVDDVLYFDDGGQWVSVDTDGFLGRVVADFIDPRVVLETVQELTETTEIGSATIDGVETTHFQSTVDLGDESLAQSGWLGFDGLAIDAEGEVTVDLFIDGGGVLNQLDLSGDVQDGAGSGESGTFEVSMNFFDIGTDITVEAPAGAQPLDPLNGFLGED
ncbi:MAG: hypothetical protein ACR2QK_23330 [Acidimicrobiales bacterium]